MSKRHLVKFAGELRATLPRPLQEQLKEELGRVFETLGKSEERLAYGKMDSIEVARAFVGYRPKFEEKAILGVEVRYQDGYETHIIKVGLSKNLKKEFMEWQNCTRERNVTSRIFAPVRLVPVGKNDRVAVLYRDAYTLFGPNHEQSRPESLEKVVDWSVQDDRPDPASVERAITHIFTDLGRWFYPGATSNPNRAVEFYREKLKSDNLPWDKVLDLWSEKQDRREMRQNAIWLICGRDHPTADLEDNPPRYLDPIEYVRWVLIEKEGRRAPDTLVGRSHGDLHARNVLLGIRRGEAEYPAVFDYGDMQTDNVLAWDFAKLEMNLRAWLLPALLHDPEVRTYLLKGYQAQRKPFPPEAESLPRWLRRERAQAQRLAAFLAFEEHLSMLADDILSREDAEPIRKLPENACTNIRKLDRLLAILLRVRKEAALWLGFERYQRQQLWRDEYYFALAVLGLVNVRWDYTRSQAECALIAAGVALANMPSTPRELKAAIAAGEDASKVYPSYRVPTALIHTLWKKPDHKEGQRLVESLVIDASTPKELRVRPEMEHAPPLLAEAVLMEMECGKYFEAERLIARLRPKAREFGDYETLNRIGSLFKRNGDQDLESATFTLERFPGSLASRWYRQAMAVCVDAFLLTGDYYPGINAATLTLLVGDRDKAKTYAQQVLHRYQQDQPLRQDHLFWQLATDGEANVVLDQMEQARACYTLALANLKPGEGGMANSAYKQLCRIWRLAEATVQEKLEPLLKLFEENQEFAGAMVPGYLGREFKGPASATSPTAFRPKKPKPKS